MGTIDMRQDADSKIVIYFTMKSMKDLKILLYLLHAFLLKHLIKQSFLSLVLITLH